MKEFALLFGDFHPQSMVILKNMYTEYESFKKTIDAAGSIIDEDIYTQCVENSNDFRSVQAVHLAVCIALSNLFLDETGLKPQVAFGFGLGEIAALHTSGMLTFEDTLEIACKREQIINSVTVGERTQNECEKLFRKTLQNYIYYRFKWPVIKDETLIPYSDEKDIINRMALSASQEKKSDALSEMIRHYNIDSFIAIGPFDFFSSVFKPDFLNIPVHYFENHLELEKVKHVYSPEEDRLGFINRCLGTACCIKNNNFNSTEYKEGVTNQYVAIQKMLRKLEKSNKEPEKEHLNEAFAMLRSVFKTKMAPAEERIRRIRRLLFETGTAHLFPGAEYGE